MDPVKQQSTFYRRGLVLGLTMAEVMLLIVFTLLMALGAVLTAQQKKLEAVDQLQEELGYPEFEGLWLYLRRLAQADEAGRSQKEGDILKEENKKLREENKLLRAETDKKNQVIARALDDLERLKKQDESELALRQGLGKCQGQLADLGRRCKGTTKPSCWVIEGKYETIYHVALMNDGIVVLPRNHPKGVGYEDVRFGDLRFNKLLTPGQFLADTRPILQWSQKQEPECRFFVRLYDETGVTQKQIYKQHRRTVEQVFHPDEMKQTPWPGRLPAQ